MPAISSRRLVQLHCMQSHACNRAKAHGQNNMHSVPLEYAATPWNEPIRLLFGALPQSVDPVAETPSQDQRESGSSPCSPAQCNLSSNQQQPVTGLSTANSQVPS